MTKTKKKNLILTLAALLLAAFAALLFIAPKSIVKADEPETPVLSNYTQQEQFTVGAKLAGKLVIICGDCSDIDPGNMFFKTETPEVFFVCPIDSVMYYAENGAFSPITVYNLTSSEIADVAARTETNNISFAFIVPDRYVTETYTEIDLTNITVTEIESNSGLDFYLFSYVETLGNDNGGETNGDDNISEENKPFDLSEWLHNAGEDVSAWLGDNVGISVKGGTVLIVGAVIIILAFRRRRR